MWLCQLPARAAVHALLLVLTFLRRHTPGSIGVVQHVLTQCLKPPDQLQILLIIADHSSYTAHLLVGCEGCHATRSLSQCLRLGLKSEVSKAKWQEFEVCVD